MQELIDRMIYRIDLSERYLRTIRFVMESEVSPEEKVKRTRGLLKNWQDEVETETRCAACGSSIAAADGVRNAEGNLIHRNC